MFYFFLGFSFIFFFIIINNLLLWKINKIQLFLILALFFLIQYGIDIKLLSLLNINKINYSHYNIFYYYFSISIMEETIKLLFGLIIAFILNKIYKIYYIQSIIYWLLISISAFIFSENLLYIKNITDWFQQFFIFILRHIFSLPIHFFILILLFNFKEKINIINFINIFIFAIFIHAINDIWYTIGYSLFSSFLGLIIFWICISLYLEIIENNKYIKNSII